jgi:hypothetical protein
MMIRKPAIALDAHMNAADVLERLALRGFWIDAHHVAARQRIASLAARFGQPFDTTAQKLARDARSYGAAIRLQSGTTLHWFAVELHKVLNACTAAAPAALLREVLELDERAAHPTMQAGFQMPLITSVVMDNGVPISVSLGSAVARESWAPPAAAAPATAAAPIAADLTTRSGKPAEKEPILDTSAWPRIDAPSFVQPRQRFTVTVGFAPAQQSGVSGGPVTLQVPNGASSLDVTVQLCADSMLTAVDGWVRTMSICVADVLAAEARFDLIAAAPARSDLPHLTMLDVRYVHEGVVCGMAAKPLVILNAKESVPAASTTTASESSQIAFTVDTAPPDLTIEIMKADRTAPLGNFVCQCYTPHRMKTPLGPFPMELGQDASTFARALVDEIALFAKSPLLTTTLEGIGKLIAQRLPPSVLEALREVAAITAPQPPAVMLVSAEPCIPWEIAWIEPRLDAQRPHFLGAQVALGRWLRDRGAASPALDATTKQRPAAHPPNEISIRTIAVMTAWYKVVSGLMRLHKAEAEARAIAERYEGVALRATGKSLQSLLAGALLERGNERVGPANAMHFSGHGDFDPAKPDASALFLEDGVPVRSTNFRAARFAAGQDPIVFLNACMTGIGDELLGDMAGFPGHSLRGGFAGVIGALWEIEDTAAQDFALEFWGRALPAPPVRGEPIGLILRDLRAKYRPDETQAPPATYLAYSYYGHPNLRLQRLAK